ncbi:hypothetical protein ACFSCX_06415 [Bacillus salitolerans]|uniref:Uncharacterized protein n=1 Tax=Bacillus salitolerans TaxID=1437434 RepID=A0ABW4LNY0_9BACI
MQVNLFNALRLIEVLKADLEESSVFLRDTDITPKQKQRKIELVQKAENFIQESMNQELYFDFWAAKQTEERGRNYVRSYDGDLY